MPVIYHRNTNSVKILFALFLAVIFYGNIQASNEEIYFGSLSTESGLSQLSVSCIFQDSKGFLWFGTRDGLNRYDGYNFEVFRNSDGETTSISNNNISSIVEDSIGNIWVATENGLNCYNYSSNNFTRYFKSTGDEGISHNKIGSLFYDRKGRLWIGTEQGLDLYNPEQSTFTKTTLDGILFNNRILSVIVDSFDNLWIGTLNKGLIQFTPETGSYHVYRHVNSDNTTISGNTVRIIFEDSKRNLWIGTRTGLCQFNPKNNTFRHFGKDIFNGEKLSNEGVRCIAEDAKKNILIGTNEGYNILNIETGKLNIYNPTKPRKGDLNHFYIYSIFIDNAGTVWLGTFAGGINYYNNFNQQFHFSNPGNLGQLVYGGVSSLVESKNMLWIGTGGGGLFCYDNLKKKYSHFQIEDSSYTSNVIKSIFIRGDSIFLSNEQSQFVIFDSRKQKVIKSLQISKNQVVNIYPEKDGKLLLCVRDSTGLRICDPKTGLVSPFTYLNATNGRKMLFPYATCLEKENDSIYWIGTRYVGLYRYNRNTNLARRYTVNPNDTNAISSNNISIIYADSRNNLWIGTGGRGFCVCDKETGKFKTYGEKEGLSNGIVLGIVSDNAGFIWISTLSGLSRFDPVTETFKNFNYGNGFPLQEPVENSFVKLSDGRLCFGGNNGIVTFSPEEISSNSFVPPLVITDFKLLRSDLKKGDIPFQRKFVPNNSSILLKYNQSSFVIQYTALNYIFPEKNQYAYQLEGFDYGWNDVGQQRIAIYTNLHSGNYRFKLKASNNDGVWNEDYITLNIKVLPPPWRSWYAYIIYFLILTGFFLLLLHYLRLEHSVKIKQFEKENIEKVHQLRIRLFTNFSHELRTPLTLIMGPLEDLLNRSDLLIPVRNSLSLIQKNTHRLLFLVNQLMDFRKQESGKMKIQAAEGKFNKFITEISMAFNELAYKQKISYSIIGNDQEIRLWFDRQELEKVFFNLLSNAFKNTPINGKISLSILKISAEDLKDIPTSKRDILLRTNATEFIRVNVSNSGKGIPAKELDKIFDPFYQVAEDGQSSVGTGIGLSLVKGIIDLHHGIVCVFSTPGEGALFCVILPVGNSYLSPDEIIKDYIGSEHINNYLLPNDQYDEAIPEPMKDHYRKYTVLVIDDNSDIRSYIRSQLQNYYHIIEASNGKAGLEKAIRQIPDLVISDIMMPEIDGLQLCLKLKNDIHTSHIPIILLTARTTYIQVKEGFEVGADDYITKPFNANMLRIKVTSVISNRERLRQSFGKKLPFELAASETTSMDEQFLKKVYQIIEKNISNTDFDIEHFSDEIGMSRASLYRKIKSLTNFSPNEFIKNYRLQVALKYLRETDLSISEISYKTGFNTPAYFTNCFKKVHKLSPSEYIQRNNISGKE